MNIAELILAVGVDNVGIQNLDVCADRLDWSEKKGTRITFGTDQPLTPEGLPKLGLVVWMPRKEAEAALARARGQSNA